MVSAIEQLLKLKCSGAQTVIDSLIMATLHKAILDKQLSASELGLLKRMLCPAWERW